MTFQDLAKKLNKLSDISVVENKYGDLLVTCQDKNALIIPKTSKCWLQTIPTETTELIPEDELMQMSQDINDYYLDKE